MIRVVGALAAYSSINKLNGRYSLTELTLFYLMSLLLHAVAKCSLPQILQ